MTKNPNPYELLRKNTELIEKWYNKPKRKKRIDRAIHEAFRPYFERVLALRKFWNED